MITSLRLSLSWSETSVAASISAAVVAFSSRTVLTGISRHLRQPRGFLAFQHLALVYPDLDADFSVCGVGFRETVVDVGADCLQRNSALVVCFGTRDFRAAQSAADHGLNAFRAEFHSPADCLAGSASERYAVLQILGDFFQRRASR